jgi:hypothetical protein
MTERMMRRDPIEHQIEQALCPGAFIRDGECLVRGRPRSGRCHKRYAHHEPSRAVGLYETFLAWRYAKAYELDDSSGSFGQLAQGSHLRLDQSSASFRRGSGHDCFFRVGVATILDSLK